MSLVVKAVYYQLANDAAVTALVATTSIVPQYLPEHRAFPAIIYDLVSTNPFQTDSSERGYDIARVEVRAMAVDYAIVCAIGEVVRTSLTSLTNTTVNTIKIHRVLLDEVNHYVNDSNDVDPIWVISQDYLIHHA